MKNSDDTIGEFRNEFVDQTLDSLQDRNYWHQLCPFLSIADENDKDGVLRRSTQLAEMKRCAQLPKENVGLLGQSLTDRGFFRLPAGQMGIPSELLCRLSLGVDRLVSHGFSPTFLLMYDEAWLIGDMIGTVIAPSTGNSPVGDWYVFYVDPKSADSYKPGPPHRFVKTWANWQSQIILR